VAPAHPACHPCQGADARAQPTAALVRRRRHRRHTCRLLLPRLAALCPALLGPCMCKWAHINANLHIWSKFARTYSVARTNGAHLPPAGGEPPKPGGTRPPAAAAGPLPPLGPGCLSPAGGGSYSLSRKRLGSIRRLAERELRWLATE
jgi:hypothetical protein